MEGTMKNNISKKAVFVNAKTAFLLGKWLISART
jgi:hypothetical protein